MGEFGWADFHKRRQQYEAWHKIVFEVEVKSADSVVLDPVEHQDYLFATEEELAADKVGDVPLSWITPPNKAMNLEAFRLRRESNVPLIETSR